MDRVLVTGGAGFIGSHFVRVVLREHPACRVVVLDKLTYAGRPENVPADDRVSFIQGDICDEIVAEAMAGCSHVFNFAAESHVDRSLLSGAGGAGVFVQTDVYGVFVLLEESRRRHVQAFVQVSTDEVYGDVSEGQSIETDALRPRSPYAAAKAGGELLARSYYVSHGVPVIVTRGSNTYGPRQYPEKLIPVFVTNALCDLQLPLYGDGLQRRDWLYVEDHALGILTAALKGMPGEAYNICGGNERTNREITSIILRLLDKPDSLIRHVEDRPGHDRRYCVSGDRMRALGWKTETDFETGMQATIDFYRDQPEWWRAIRNDAEYQAYYKSNYEKRLTAREG